MNIEKALELLGYVDLTVLSKEELAKRLPDAIFIENKKTDTQGFIHLNKSGIFIVFRGTESKYQDWLTDAKFMHKVIPYGNNSSNIRVHQGFLEAYKSVRDDVIKQVEIIARSVKAIKIITIGHSLGGALATLCAVDMQYNFPKLLHESLTFGGPRVGNRAFALSYNKRVPDTNRVYLKKDIVPMVPMSWLELGSGGYVHVEQSNPIGPNNWLLGVEALIIRYFQSKRLAADLANHSVTLYRQELKKLLTNP